MRCLLIRDIQAFTKYLAVAACLVEKVHKIAVFKDILDLRRGKKVLDILRDTRGDTAPFTEAFPNLHAPGSHLAAQQKVELVNKIPGGFAQVSVLGYSVPYLVLNDEHTQAFQLLAQLLDIEAYKAVVDIHVRPVIEYVERTVDIELQRRRDSLCLGLRLPLDLVV